MSEARIQDGDSVAPAGIDAAVRAAIEASDITEQVTSSIDRALRRRIDKITATAVDAALTNDVLTELRSAADVAAAAALTTPPSEISEDSVGGDDPAASAPLHESVEAWVTHVYVTTFIRRDSERLRWCARWWQHPEAIVRLTALWLTWEAARLAEDPHPMADWLWRYLDSIGPLLHSPDGTFSDCDPEECQVTAPMRVEPAPANWWDD